MRAEAWGLVRTDQLRSVTPLFIDSIFILSYPHTGSPFSVPVHDTVDATKVKCQGQGLGNNVRANIPQVFSVDASKAGVAPLQVRVQGPKGESMTRVILFVWMFFFFFSIESEDCDNYCLS